jgi:hypothetical protein
MCKSDPDFKVAIAITIPIENNSGKIAIRFRSQNRFAIESIHQTLLSIRYGYLLVFL